jgi:hypothetical protein
METKTRIASRLRMLKTDAVGIFLLWVMLGSLLLSGAPQTPDFEGRWNVTETGKGGKKSYSWIELNREDSGWRGLFLHRGGHPQAAEITVKGSELTVRRLPDDPAAAPSDGPLPTIVGTIKDGMLSGSGTDSRGNPFEWEGTRAPNRKEGSDREVAWGEPINLFNGQNLDGWVAIGDRPNHWNAVDGLLSNEKSGANLRTADEFRDFKLRLEFKIPEGSNSGIYMRGRYETQVADLHGQPPHNRGVGGIYGHLTPSVNMVRPAGEWNVVELTLIGYRVTVAINGETTINGELLPGITGGALDANEAEPGPIMLQGDHGPVAYRNIVLTPAD